MTFQPQWTRDEDDRLTAAIIAGKSFSVIADEMYVTRSTIAGRVKRLRDCGKLTHPTAYRSATQQHITTVGA